MIGAPFAFIAGAIATVNPCGLALLPAYLARRLVAESADQGGGAAAVTRALGVGAATTAGLLAVFGVVGGAASLGIFLISGAALSWIGVAIGVLLTGTGLAVLAGRPVRLRLPVPGTLRPGGTLSGDFLFGVGYGAISLSCTLPIFLAVVGTAVSTNPLESALSFVAYGFGMGTIFTSIAVAAGLSRSGLARVLRGASPYMDRLGGALLLLAGVYVTYYWLNAILAAEGPREGDAILLFGARVSAFLRGWVGAEIGQAVTLGVLVFLVPLIAWALWRKRSGNGFNAVPPAVREPAGDPTRGRG